MLYKSSSSAWTANRVVAVVFGIIFVLLGILGFIARPENSTGVVAILGLFDGDLVHNIVFLITGLLGIGAAFMGRARMFNQVFGIVYVVWGLLSLIPALFFPASKYGTDGATFLGLTHMNAGDIILNLIAGVIALVVAYMVTDSNRFRRSARGASEL
jgi:hypothetical protein